MIYRPWKLDHDFGIIKYIVNDSISTRFSANGNYPLENFSTVSNFDLGKNFHLLPERRIDNENLVVKMEDSVFKKHIESIDIISESKVTISRRRFDEESIREYFLQSKN